MADQGCSIGSKPGLGLSVVDMHEPSSGGEDASTGPGAKGTPVLDQERRGRQYWTRSEGDASTGPGAKGTYHPLTIEMVDIFKKWLIVSQTAPPPEYIMLVRCETDEFNNVKCDNYVVI